MLNFMQPNLVLQLKSLILLGMVGFTGYNIQYNMMHTIATHATFFEPAAAMVDLGQNMLLQLLGFGIGKKPLVRKLSGDLYLDKILRFSAIHKSCGQRSITRLFSTQEMTTVCSTFNLLIMICLPAGCCMHV